MTSMRSPFQDAALAGLAGVFYEAHAPPFRIPTHAAAHAHIRRGYLVITSAVNDGAGQTSESGDKGS